MQSAAEIIGQTILTKPVATSKPVKIHSFVASWRWTYELYHPVHETMLAEAVRFASDVLSGAEPRWLSFLGASGVGKTFLLNQVVSLLRAASRAKLEGDEVETFFEPKVWRYKTSTGHRVGRVARINPAVDLDSYLAPREYASEFDVVFIEDIAAFADADKGSGAVTRARLAELLQLRSRRWTMLDANLSISQVEQTFDGRIASRLRRDDSTCIQIPEDVADYSLRS